MVGLSEKPRPGRLPLFAPEVALHVVEFACERPDRVGRSLSRLPIALNWLATSKLRERFAAFRPKLSGASCVLTNSNRGDTTCGSRRKFPATQVLPSSCGPWLTCILDPSPPMNSSCVWTRRPIDPPRPRLAPTLPARSGQYIRLEHEYKRAGALHLFAAFDRRTGKVYAYTGRRKRQEEFIALLKHLDREVPPAVTRIYLVLDNASIHKGRRTQAWLTAHPRFVCFFLPVHCSWMNQVEQWFSILQRKRLRILDFSDLDRLAERLMTFVAEWNVHAHPFNWSTKSAVKVMAKCEAQTLYAAAA